MQISFWDMTPSQPSKSTPTAAKVLRQKAKEGWFLNSPTNHYISPISPLTHHAETPPLTHPVTYSVFMWAGGKCKYEH